MLQFYLFVASLRHQRTVFANVEDEMPGLQSTQSRSLSRSAAEKKPDVHSAKPLLNDSHGRAITTIHCTPARHQLIAFAMCLFRVTVVFVHSNGYSAVVVKVCLENGVETIEVTHVHGFVKVRSAHQRQSHA